MANRVVHVPVALLLAANMTPSAKVVWIARHLFPDAGPAELEGRTGLSRHTILRFLGQSVTLERRGSLVTLPGALLAERSVGAPAKVLYGLLQAVPGFRGEQGQFTYAALSAQTQMCCNTLKRAVAELVGAGWVQVTQANRLSPIAFTLGSREDAWSRAETEAARRRLDRADHTGEALMQEYLSLLIEADEFTDNARPGFLINPLTGERLELDRFYPPQVAFEFHGDQHFRATGRFSQEQADAQHLRDLIKAGLCVYRGIHLVVVQAEDLTLQGMIRRVGQCLPRRDLAGHERLIDLLEDESFIYRAAARGGGQGRRGRWDGRGRCEGRRRLRGTLRQFLHGGSVRACKR